MKNMTRERGRRLGSSNTALMGQIFSKKLLLRNSSRNGQSWTILAQGTLHLGYDSGASSLVSSASIINSPNAGSVVKRAPTSFFFSSAKFCLLDHILVFGAELQRVGVFMHLCACG